MLVDKGTCIAGRFDVEELAGAGGMGAVYRARDRVSGDVVALEMLRHDRDGARQHLPWFLREARALAALDHPGIVRYVAEGEAETGARHLAMEWLDGETLEARIEREALSAARGPGRAARRERVRGGVLQGRNDSETQK